MNLAKRRDAGATGRSVVVLSFLCALSGVFRAHAGDLNPPPGQVAPTHKTLTDVEPRIAVNATNTPGDDDSLFKIVAPGSYYLTGNVTGVVGKHGIEIVTSGVTLNLNGFDMVGVGAMGGFDGVSVTVFDLTNIAVVNGSVRNWGDDGVDLRATSATNCRVEGVLASDNGGIGITVGGGSAVSNCLAFRNGSHGISTNSGCTVSNCSAFSNSVDGISVGGVGCMVTNCLVSDNTGSGISANVGCRVTNCTAELNNIDGISTNSGCTVSNCSAASNTGNGISVNTGSTVADCTARLNILDGIVCASSCVIRGNTCSSNGNTGDGAGIHATSADNRIEGNNCTIADRGIDVDAAGNIIIKNTCSGNTIDWVIAADNIYGPIIDRRAPASAAVSGFGAVTTLGSTDPNANFSY